jgi:hypothetical protein
MLLRLEQRHLDPGQFGFEIRDDFQLSRRGASRPPRVIRNGSGTPRRPGGTFSVLEDRGVVDA